MIIMTYASLSLSHWKWHLHTISSSDTDWVKVSRPTRRKIGHFGDVRQANFSALYGKTNLTQQKHALTSQNKCTTTQINTKKLRPGLVASYDIWPGNSKGLFLFRHFINLSLTHLLRHLQPQTHRGNSRHRSECVFCWYTQCTAEFYH